MITVNLRALNTQARWGIGILVLILGMSILVPFLSPTILCWEVAMS